MSTNSEVSTISLSEPNPSLIPEGESLKKLFIPLGILLLGLLYFSSVSDPSTVLLVILGLIITIPAGILAWNHPELSLLALVFLESNIILPDELVDVRLGVGGLDLRDIVLLGTLGITFVKELLQRRITLKLFPISGLLLLFLILASFSLINALVFEKAAFNWAFNDYRLMLYYTLFFSVSWGISSQKQLKTFIAGLYGIANFVVLLMIAQPFFGIDNLLTSGMSKWQITEEAGEGLRILPPLILLIALLIVISICYAYFTNNRKYRLIAIAQSSVLILGFLLTYTRSAWVTVIFALLLVLAYIAFYNFKQVGTVLLFISPVLLSFVLFFTTVPKSTYSSLPLVGDFLERGASIFETEETTESDSLQWRFYENSEAIRSIRERPIFGVGLGNQYREITIILGEAAGTRTTDDITRLTRYVHNSFLSMAVKMGLSTLLLFLTTYLAFIFVSWKLHFKVSDAVYKSIAMGTAITFVPCLFWAQFFSLYTESNHITSVAIFMGLVAVIAESVHNNNTHDQIDLEPTQSAA
ncbi:MAG: O-antigen ligase family protein [Anaerolineae bacterium]